MDLVFRSGSVLETGEKDLKNIKFMKTESRRDESMVAKLANKA
jgi:hypothetical protein